MSDTAARLRQLRQPLLLEVGPAAAFPSMEAGSRRVWPWLVPAALLLVALSVGATLLAVRAQGSGQESLSNGRAAMSSPVVTPADPPSGIAAIGYAVASRSSTVTAEVTGRLTAVWVKEGQAVKRGQVVAQIESTLAGHDAVAAAARVQSAVAAARVMGTELASARRSLQRTAELAAVNFVSDNALAQEQARVQSQSAQLERAEADVLVARADAARIGATQRLYDIRSPIDGVVTERSASAGETVSPIAISSGFSKAGICTVVDLASLEVVADVREKFASRLHVGQPAELSFEAIPARTFKARLSAVLPTVNRDKGSIRVRLEILDPSHDILPDMAASVVIGDLPKAKS